MKKMYSGNAGIKIMVLILVFTMVGILMAGCSSGDSKKTEDQKAQPILMKFGHLFAESHFEHKAALYLQEQVDKATGGKIKVEIYPAAQLGSEEEMYKQLKAGAIQLASGGAGVTKFVPEFGLHALPGLWRDYDHFRNVMASDIGKKLIALPSEKKTGYKVIGLSPNGFRHFMHRSKAITQLSDFKGVQIRVDSQPISPKIWQAVGANPVPLAFNEVYSALQTGVINSAEQPMAGTITQKFYEVAKYHTLTGHQLTCMAITTNEDWWNKLPADLQKALDGVFADYLTFRTKLCEEADNEAMNKLKELGAEIYELKDADAFRAKLEPLQKEFGDEYKVNDIIEAIKAVK